MERTVKTNIKKILKQSISAIKKGDSFRLKEISNQNIHSAVIFQDEDSITMLVLIYSLSKIIERVKNTRPITLQMEKCLESLEADDETEYKNRIREIINLIKSEYYGFKRFATTIIERAQIKKGCMISEHGVSLSRVSKMFGISKWEFMKYFGKACSIETSSEKVSTEKRLKLARRLFS